MLQPIFNLFSTWMQPCWYINVILHVNSTIASMLNVGFRLPCQHHFNVGLSTPIQCWIKVDNVDNVGSTLIQLTVPAGMKNSNLNPPIFQFFDKNSKNIIFLKKNHWWHYFPNLNSTSFRLSYTFLTLLVLNRNI